MGLENPIGANNCFLNVVLQSLWHLPALRSPLESLTHRCASPELCMLCALKVLWR